MQRVLSGYGLTIQPRTEELVIGLLTTDRPQGTDPKWLCKVEPPL
jgi:hypothetical protein